LLAKSHKLCSSADDLSTAADAVATDGSIPTHAVVEHLNSPSVDVESAANVERKKTTQQGATTPVDWEVEYLNLRNRFDTLQKRCEIAEKQAILRHGLALLTLCISACRTPSSVTTVAPAVPFPHIQAEYLETKCR